MPKETAKSSGDQPRRPRKSRRREPAENDELVASAARAERRGPSAGRVAPEAPPLRPREALAVDDAEPLLPTGTPQLVSSEFVWHSFLLLVGRMCNRLLEFYRRFFVLRKQDETRIYENLGHGFRKKGQSDKALTAYRELIKRNPRNADAYYQMGRIYGAKGEDELAVRAYRSAIKCRADHADAHHRLGLLYARAGDLERAIETLGQAVELAPDDHRLLYRLGVYHDKNGAPEQALPILKRAVELHRDEPRYHQYLGFVYEGLGNHDEAIAHFKAVMEIEGAQLGF